MTDFGLDLQIYVDGDDNASCLICWDPIGNEEEVICETCHQHYHRTCWNEAKRKGICAYCSQLITAFAFTDDLLIKIADKNAAFMDKLQIRNLEILMRMMRNIEGKSYMLTMMRKYYNDKYDADKDIVYSNYQRNLIDLLINSIRNEGLAFELPFRMNFADEKEVARIISMSIAPERKLCDILFKLFTGHKMNDDEIDATSIDKMRIDKDERLRYLEKYLIYFVDSTRFVERESYSLQSPKYAFICKTCGSWAEFGYCRKCCKSYCRGCHEELNNCTCDKKMHSICLYCRRYSDPIKVTMDINMQRHRIGNVDLLKKKTIDVYFCPMCKQAYYTFEKLKSCIADPPFEYIKDDELTSEFFEYGQELAKQLLEYKHIDAKLSSLLIYAAEDPNIVIAKKIYMHKRLRLSETVKLLLPHIFVATNRSMIEEVLHGGNISLLSKPLRILNAFGY